MTRCWRTSGRTLVCAVVLVASGCRRERASAEDCALILDRIVETELTAAGFRDPALAARKKAQLRNKLHAELSSCPAHSLRPGALECVKRASSSDDISHKCLR
ncbi:MAG TPA: hypothetical protein VG963_33345 [Polyangiaceae bacterium]|nr:hypothetical protein [Polyangiaceae bacterium]